VLSAYDVIASPEPDGVAGSSRERPTMRDEAAKA
jgi:hypothetical protein